MAIARAGYVVAMARLRRSSPDDAGWGRRRADKGFVYVDAEGGRLPAEDAERAKSLVIHPAWMDVWICPWPNGHLRAVGTDEAGRRQCLYHPDWRTQHDAEKHGSLGLTTLQRRHAQKKGVTFRFVGKSGIAHVVTIDDPAHLARHRAGRCRLG